MAIIEQYLGKELEGESWRKSFDSGTKWVSRLKLQARPTIIVPIYNGLDAVTRMLESLESTAMDNRIILVDDFSSHHAVSDLCSTWAGRFHNSFYMRNSRNLGFVRSVNVGIAQADAECDVVILNSDTILSPGIIDQLSAAAYAQSNIATVTPLSNAAGVFSLPYPKVSNVLPAEWSVSFFANMLKCIAPVLYERIPSGSGFCLYITRNAIDSIGIFDECLFYRGYGEETDFCRRAVSKGLENRVDVTGFVFHQREASFGGEKAVLKLTNTRLLKAIDDHYINESLEWEKTTCLHYLWECLPELAETDILQLDMPWHHEGLPSSVSVGVVDERSQIRSDGIFVRQSEEVTVEFFGRVTRRVDMDGATLGDLLAYLRAKWNVRDLVSGGEVYISGIR